MREVHISWKPETIESSEFKQITDVTEIFEVIAHLDITPVGVRQLVRVQFVEEMGPENLDSIPFLEVDGPLPPHPLPKDGEEGIIVMWNRHPISIAAISFDGLHIVPPYTVDKNGISITIRGLPNGISGFLKAARMLLPPDSVKVVDMDISDEEILKILTPKQLEATIIAVNSGYYDSPRTINLNDLSELAGVSRSTLQEHLSKAEAALMKLVAEMQGAK